MSHGADLRGAVLLTAGLMLGVYTILGVIEYGWTSTRTLSLAGIAAALLIAFVVRQARIDNPLMPLRLFRSREVTGSNIVMALLVVGLFGLFFLGALYLQRVLGYSPLQVGLAFLPSTVVMGATSLRFSMRFAPRTIVVPAMLLIAAGMLLFMRAPVDGTFVVDVLPATILIGLGAGLSTPALMTLAMYGVQADRRRPRLRPGQHDRAGRRRDRPGRAGDAGQRAHRRVAGARGAAVRLPPGVPDRRRDARPRRARRAGPPAPDARGRSARAV